MITVENLSKKYSTKQVLTGINVAFDYGKVYGIVGENGAGKTTLFRCIAGLEQYSGAVDSDLKPLKNRLGLLPTEPYFFSKMTGAEYIRLLCNARHITLDDINKKNVFDLPLNEYASVYSTGMKKKLALTALLLQNNVYFILDEPFNGVDIQSNMIITEIIHTLKRMGTTVVISSHIFSTLSDTCDEIHVLNHGPLVKTVGREQFAALESEMKSVTIGDKIQKLGLG